MFSEHTLTEIRARTDIIELVSQYLELKKSGLGYVGLCPFHGEKTGSFHVTPQKQVFKCFGCGKGGNVFTFLRMIEGISFPQAVKRLAESAGVDISAEWQQNAPKRQISSSMQQALDALDWAAKYFHYLLKEHKDYQNVRGYLSKRGISDKSIEKFCIGASPTGWNTLRDLMLKRKFDRKVLSQAGLIVDPDNAKGGYDRFRERLMFPIRDPQGQVIGFGARLLKEDPKQPKYLNSVDSPIFSKRKHLYGLYENQRAIRLKGEAILVEGYMDVVGLSEKGVENSVATMGTALTEDHCFHLKSFSKKMVTVFDPDAAGREASKRSIPIFLDSGILAKDLTLPENMDPDEYAMKYGSESFYKLCENAPRQVDKLLKEVATQGQLNAENRAKALNELTPILQASKRLPDRAMLWDSISLVLNISVESLVAISEGGPKAPQKTNNARTLPSTTQNPNSYGGSPPPIEDQQFSQSRPQSQGFKPKKKWVPDKNWKFGKQQRRYNPQENDGSSFSNTGPNKTSKESTSQILEKEFFVSLMRCPEKFLATDASTWEAAIEDGLVKEIVNNLYNSSNLEEFTKKAESLLSQQTPEYIESAITGWVMNPKSGDAQAEAYFDAIMSRVIRRKKEVEIHSISAQVRLNQQLGDEGEQLRLLEQIKQLRSELDPP